MSTVERPESHKERRESHKKIFSRVSVYQCGTDGSDRLSLAILAVVLDRPGVFTVCFLGAMIVGLGVP